jgi:hypothetical protein
MSKTAAQNKARSSCDGKRGERICLNTAFQCTLQVWRFLLFVGL